MGRVDNDYDNYALTHPESEAAAVSSDSKLAITFALIPRYAGSAPRSRG